VFAKTGKPMQLAFSRAVTHLPKLDTHTLGVPLFVQHGQVPSSVSMVSLKTSLCDVTNLARGSVAGSKLCFCCHRFSNISKFVFSFPDNPSNQAWFPKLKGHFVSGWAKVLNSCSNLAGDPSQHNAPCSTGGSLAIVSLRMLYISTTLLKQAVRALCLNTSMHLVLACVLQPASDTCQQTLKGIWLSGYMEM
jgi:hypothetical protein